MAIFIVNSNGGVHNVEKHTDAPADSRPATHTEIGAWYAAQKLETPAEYAEKPVVPGSRELGGGSKGSKG